MKRVMFAMIGLALTATAAAAHPGHGIEATFAHGFMHPINGLDHVLAMLTVGLLAFSLGGSAIWAVPVTFIVAMIAGAGLGLMGIGLPLVEPMIASSVIILGALVALGLRLPMSAVIALVAVFAAFHGFAHGTEAPAGQDVLVWYGAGFVLATALLHLAGIVTGMGASRLLSTIARVSLRASGAAISIAGVGLLTGII